MKKVILIDDEPLARSVVLEYLQDFSNLQVVQECGDGFEGVKAIHQHQPDLIFLDVQMPKISGFEMLELLDTPPAVIFTTAFDEYALKAFEAHAIDYLLKPFAKDRFAKAVNKWLDTQASPSTTEKQAQLMAASAQHGAQANRIVLKDGSKIKIIPHSEIVLLEAADDYVKINTAEGVFLKNKTMSFFEEQLDATVFCRCHRSFIINTQLISRIDAYEKDSHLVLLKNGAKVPASRAGYAKLRAMLGL
jgi:two-component system, LytTR family, response regulator